jgi:hypothetical protein
MHLRLLFHGNSNNRIKEDQMSGACSMYGRDEKYRIKFVIKPERKS